jgi:hypothetical protein
MKSSATMFIVRVHRYAVHFHTNLCGKVYSVVRDGEATRFYSQVDAARAARDCNLNPAEYTIENAL